MLIEQTIKFELRGLGALVERVLLNPDIFMTKQKSPKQILQQLFTAKNIAGGNVPCFSHLNQVTYKIQHPKSKF